MSKTTNVSLNPLPRLIFASRWLQLPLYLGLIVAQGVYVFLFLKELWNLIHDANLLSEQGIMLMLCDRCAIERSLAAGEPGDCRPSGTVAGVRVGCFPDLYRALSENPPDQVITL